MVILGERARGTGEFSSAHQQTDVISHLTLVPIRYAQITDELEMRLVRRPAHVR